MLAEDISEQAIARWLAHGVTSRTHPVLHYVLRTCFQPLGIDADALEAEPFSTVEAGIGDWWLQQPRWEPARFDRTQSALADFGFLLESPVSFKIAVSPHGWLLIEPARGAERDLAVEAFMKSTDDGWTAARHSLQAAREAEAFLYGAVGALIADESLALLYAGGDDDAFCAAMRESLATADSATDHRPTSAALSSTAVRATIVR